MTAMNVFDLSARPGTTQGSLPPAPHAPSLAAHDAIVITQWRRMAIANPV